MSSLSCFELSYDHALWGDSSWIDDVQRCLLKLHILYTNIEKETQLPNAKVFIFRLLGISKSKCAADINLIPQLTLERHYQIHICLRHKKQVATIAIADSIDLSILRTAIFYYLAYYDSTYQYLQHHKSTILAERAALTRQIELAKEKVTLLQQRDLFEDDDIILEALEELYIQEELQRQNGKDKFDIEQAIGCLFRFKKVEHSLDNTPMPIIP